MQVLGSLRPHSDCYHDGNQLLNTQWTRRHIDGRALATLIRLHKFGSR